MVKKRRRRRKNSRKNEIWGIVLVALSLLLLIGLFLSPMSSGEGIGAIGRIMTMVLQILAGTAAIIIPFFMLVWGVMIFADKGKTLLQLRFLGLLLLFLACLGLMHFAKPLEPFVDYITTSAMGEGGGILGGLVSYSMRLAFGQAGGIIILAAIAVIGLVLLTRVSLFNLFRQFGAYVSSILGLDDEEKKEQRAARREERAARRGLLQAGEYDDDYEDEYYGEEDEDSTPAVAPLIISHDGPLQDITDPSSGPSAKPLPDPNRFANNFFPVVDSVAEKELEPEPETVTETADQSLNTKHLTDTTDLEKEEVVFSAGQPTDEVGEKEYVLPPVELMSMGIKVKNPRMNKAIADSVSVLESTLNNFGIKAKVMQVVAGPAVTRYELQPAPGVKVSKITSLSDDIALSLAATDVRIEAPIPGKAAVGIEVPRAEISTVYFREVIESEAFIKHPSKIAFALGKNIGGEVIVADLAKMPHLLIAGATGSGKSICINSLICSILYKAKPNEVKLMLIDPKKVELTGYKGLPHLVSPVITDNKKAASSLKWVVNEMETRYTLFSANGVKDFTGFNKKFSDSPLHQIVVIIDELADLMFVAPADVEESICRLAQMARAAGIHLVVATQRPSVDVITGLIKANIPSRIAFAVSSNTDSRTILDMAGAEKLLGRGDMLFHPVGMPKPQRIQGTYIEEKDIYKLVEYCHSQASPQFYEEVTVSAAEIEKTVDNPADEDALFFEAGELVISTGQASTSFLQRRLRIGNPRAGRLIDILESRGVVSGPDGSKPRNVLMTMDEFNAKFRVSRHS
ncbi:MAG: DNA translocase FtsK [Bacillota bacterium]